MMKRARQSMVKGKEGEDHEAEKTRKKRAAQASSSTMDVKQKLR